MQKNHLRKLKIRRGNDNQRKVTLFEEGELVFIKDTERVYVGDDNTTGGIKISNKNYFTFDSIKPIGAETEDLYFDQIDKSTYMVDVTGGSILIIPSVIACCINIKKDIDIIDSLLKRISGECCNPDNFLATDLDNPPVSSDNILTDNTDTIRVK
jgi:hypothetical protein